MAATDRIQIDGLNGSKMAHLQLYHSAGRLITSRQLMAPYTFYLPDDLANGAYLIQLAHDGHSQSLVVAR